MGNIKIKDAKDLENNETETETEQPNDSQTVNDAEEAVDKPENSETESEEAKETAEEQTETAEEASEADKEEKPEKKERKLKWARSDEKKADKAANAFEEKIREANDKYARLFAEFDNFRKRSEKEKSQRYDFGVKDMVERILPVIDNFERGLSAAEKEGKGEDSFVKGMEMTYKQLLKTLEDAGVKPIEAVGQEFNPDFHNAVMHVDDPEAGENIIVEEFQKGYMYKDHVVRYSMVKVAN